MTTTLFMAMSLNGRIADASGSEAFLSDAHWEQFCAHARVCGAVIIGRRTYEAVRSWDNSFGFEDLAGVPFVVLTRDPAFPLAAGFQRAASPQEALALVQERPRALVAGGAGVNAAFLEAGLLDEIIVSIEPALLGTGTPLVAPWDGAVRLSFISAETHAEGLVTLRYRVLRGAL